MATQKSDPDIPELYQDQRNWRLIELVVASVLLLVVIGFLVWFFFFRGTSTPVSAPSSAPKFSHNGTIGPNGASSKNNSSSKSGANSSSGTSNSANSGAAGTNPSSGNSASGNGSANTPNASASSNLTNTGPGDVIAIFLGASAIGALAYQLKSCRAVTRR